MKTSTKYCRFLSKSDMSNVLLIVETINSTTELAISGISKILKVSDIQPRVILLKDITHVDITWCDVCIAVRPNTPGSLDLAKCMKQHHKIYCVLFDDDLINRPSSLNWRRKISRRCVAVADVLISTSLQILEEYKQYMVNTSRCMLINTPIDESEYKIVVQNSNCVRCVYAAGKDHAQVFEKYVLPAIENTLQLGQKRIELTFVGVHPDMSKCSVECKVNYIPLMPLEEYNSFMKREDFDIGFAPLDETSFSSRKYFNKYLEYSKLGIFGMYSNCLPYTLVVQNGVNGEMVDNTEKCWIDAFERVVNDPGYRSTCIKTAQMHLKEQFSVQSVAQDFVKNIPELLSYHNCEKCMSYNPKRAVQMLFFVIDRGHRLLELAKSEGLSGIIKKICSNTIS